MPSSRIVALERVSAVPNSEFSETFVQRMLKAMEMSFFKYGLVADAYPAKVDAIRSLKARLAKYEETGNADYLVDVANFAMIETMGPRHPQFFWKATDSSESIGRVWSTGEQSEAANTLIGENIRRGAAQGSTKGGLYKRDGD